MRIDSGFFEHEASPIDPFARKNVSVDGCTIAYVAPSDDYRIRAVLKSGQNVTGIYRARAGKNDRHNRIPNVGSDSLHRLGAGFGTEKSHYSLRPIGLGETFLDPCSNLDFTGRRG